jgi:hypothetical protein
MEEAAAATLSIQSSLTFEPSSSTFLLKETYFCIQQW